MYRAKNNSLTSHNQLSNRLKRRNDYLIVARVERILDGNYQLRHDGQNLIAAHRQHIRHTISGQQLVGYFVFGQSARDEH